jgi:hypothetical protein
MSAADDMGKSSRMQLVAFVIFSDSISVEKMTSVMGLPADFALDKGAVREGARARIPARHSSWEMREESETISEAADRLFQRLKLVRDGLRELREIGCSAKLSIVQYVTPRSDLGISIKAMDLRLLADAGAFLDIDQYVED